MRKTLLFIVIALGVPFVLSAQDSKTRYFSSVYLDKEVSKVKGKFSETVTKNEDGSVTTEILNLKKNELVRSETFKGDEPYGVWKFEKGSGREDLDYSFPLKYADGCCNESENAITVENYFTNNASKNYVAPTIASGEQGIAEFISMRVFYPRKAVIEGTMGKVVMIMTITEKGEIENICVKSGVNPVIDKEAVRVIRQLKLSAPAMVNGKATRLCVTTPCNFTLN